MTTTDIIIMNYGKKNGTYKEIKMFPKELYYNYYADDENVAPTRTKVLHNSNFDDRPVHEKILYLINYFL